MWCATQQIVKSSWSPQIQDDLWCDVQQCEQQLKKSTNSGRSLMLCGTQQTVSSSWGSPQIRDDLWCDVQHSRLWAAAEVYKFRMISDVMCNTADCKQQLKMSTNSGWSLTWCATQQIVSSSWISPQIQDDLWCFVQHSRLGTAAEVQKFRAISDVVCNKAGWEAVKCWHLLVLSIITTFSYMNRMSRPIIQDKLFFRISIKIHYSISVLQKYFLWWQQQNY